MAISLKHLNNLSSAQVPEGRCRKLVVYMAWCYFISWTMFPALFLAGPEGFKVLTPAGSHIGHVVADFLSKNLWGAY